mgnify:CR=1 FL=1
MITIENLNFGYSEKRILTVPHMEIKEKQHLMILGKSGSGKTTLLHILGGLLKPVEGKVIIDETNLYQLSGSEMDKYRGQNIGLVFQKAQRETIARALLNKPRVILADEPTASLDDDNANSVIQLLKEQAESNNASLIIATHDQRVKDAFDLQLNLNEQ